MKKLSEIKALDEKSLKAIAGLINSLDINSIYVKHEHIEDTIKHIVKKETRPLKGKVIVDYSERKVIPVLDPVSLDNMPPFIPFWTLPNSGKSVTVVNVTRFSRIDKKTKEISIYPKTMFGLLLAGTVMNKLQQNENMILSSTKLLTALCCIYSRIFTKILDKNYAISANEIYLDQVRYLTAKFFLLSVVGRPDSASTSDIAAKAIGNSSKQAVMQVDSQLPPGSFENMLTFIDGLKSVFKRLTNLSYRNILAEIAKGYSAPAFLMMEYVPYFIANILYTVTNSGINNEYSFESVLGKDGIVVYQELARLI